MSFHFSKKQCGGKRRRDNYKDHFVDLKHEVAGKNCVIKMQQELRNNKQKSKTAEIVTWSYCKNAVTFTVTFEIQIISTFND